MRAFKYDVVALIQSIRDRPCLWDKSLESYKDRIERKAAWEEIYSILDDRYEQMTAAEKRMTEQLVVHKWTNIRDTFMKSLKTRMGRPKRKYIFYDHLKFLTKVWNTDEPVEFNDFSSNFLKQEDDASDKNEQCEETDYTPKKKKKRDSDHSSDDYTNKKKSKKKVDKCREESNDIDFVEVDTNDPRVMNEDEAFFASLLPSVVRYDEDERLEFRIEVLAVMQRIKEKRKWAKNN